MELKELTNLSQAERILKFFFGQGVWYWNLSGQEKKTIRKRVETALKEKPAKYWFVETDKGKVIAAGGTDELKDTEGGFYFTWFAVQEKWRRQGLGRKIIGQAENHALKNKARFMTIDTGEGNKEANIFYQKTGYLKVGQIPDYYGPGDGKVIYFKKFSNK